MLVTEGILDGTAVALGTRPPSLRLRLPELTMPVWLARKMLVTPLLPELSVEIARLMLSEMLGWTVLVLLKLLAGLGTTMLLGWIVVLLPTLLVGTGTTTELLLLDWTAVLLPTSLVGFETMMLLDWTMTLLLSTSLVETGTTTLLGWLVLKLPAGLATTRPELGWMTLELLKLALPER